MNVKKPVSVLAAALILSMLAAACSSPSEEAAPATSSEPAAESSEFSAEDVTTASSLWQINGHHLVAIQLGTDGDFQGAVAHTRHPIDELMASVSTEVAERGGPDGSSNVQALDEQTKAAADAAAAEDLAGIETAAAQTSETVTAAAAALPGGASEAFTGSVIADLLTTVGNEYEEAVVDGKVKMPVEFQDAYAFVTVANARYEEIAATVEAKDTEAAEEIEEAFSTLTSALPGPVPVPSQRIMDAGDVVFAADLISRELEETVGALVSQEVDPSETFASIDALLTEVQAAYDAGKPEVAAELAAEAYLEHYELVEASVIEAAPDVNAELEPLLGADLRAQIAGGVPPEELKSMIARARELIAQAQQATGGMSEDDEMESNS